MNARRTTLPLLIAFSIVAASCGDDTDAPVATTAATPVIDPGDGGNYQPDLDPASIAPAIDNPYLPLAVGSRWRYEGESEDGAEVTEVVVTGDRKTVMGISAYVVRDTVTVDGELVEDTLDWFTQDVDGNVWYLGEQVQNFEDGKLESTDGSWEAGVDGALPGIVMPAVPAVGDAYRQEFYPGEAEDLMEIIATGGDATVAAGTYADVVTAREWNPLEPDVVEEKDYAPGVGLIQEREVGGTIAELVEYVAGSA